MKSEQQSFLSLAKPPARLNVEQAAWYLGFSEHDIPILVAAGLLKPLGNPPPNGTKYFGSSVLDELRQDTKWLARATDALHGYWRKQKAHKGTGRAPRSRAAAMPDESAT